MPVIKEGGRVVRPFQHYPTEPRFVQAMVRLVVERHLPPALAPLRFLDPGAGDGVYGENVHKFLPDAMIMGSELRPVVPNPIYHGWHQEDFTHEPTFDDIDVVIGNPPFGNELELFIRQAYKTLRDDGIIAFLTRSGAGWGQGRCSDLFQTHGLTHIYRVPERVSFTGDGKTDADEYAILIFRKCKNYTYQPAITNILWWKQGYSVGQPPEGFRGRTAHRVRARSARRPQGSETPQASEGQGSEGNYLLPGFQL